MDDLAAAQQLVRLASDYTDNGLPVQAYTLSQAGAAGRAAGQGAGGSWAPLLWAHGARAAGGDATAQHGIAPRGVPSPAAPRGLYMDRTGVEAS